MTLAQAIEIKSRTGEEFLHTDPEELEEADRLSIEALKRCRTLAQESPLWKLHPLPGETED